MSVVLITGCSTGLGFATAEVLARQGHSIYATMRKPQQSPELAQKAAQDNLPITILPLDVDSDESVRTAVEQVLAQAGQIDVLVNNAGIGGITVVEESPLELYKRLMETNYFGALRCMQAVLPSMRQRKSGLIINISSIAGKLYPPFFGAYSSSKAALEALSECLAGEVAEFGIRVAVVEPGIIYTPIMDKLEQVPLTTQYPKQARLRALLLTSLDNHVPASVVGDVIDEIISGKRTGFRHPAAPDAQAFLSWRASSSDEDYIASAGIDEETWIAQMDQMGKNVRPYLKTNAQTAALT